MNKNILWYMTLCLCIVSHTTKTEDFQLYTADDVQIQEDVKIVECCLPIRPTASGFSEFLGSAYNQPRYAQDFLPNSFEHMTQLLTHGKETKKPRSYVQMTLRLFSNKLKGATYVNPSAVTDLLNEVPNLVQQYFLEQRNAQFALLHENINTLLYNNFLKKFSYFKHSPDSFFNDLSQEIVDALSSSREDENDITIDELRKTLLVFLEVALGKLIWCPDDKINTWHSVKKISEQLATLMNSNIIDDPDDLNDLYVTLVERYCYFIDLAGVKLPNSFYETIKEDINTSQLLLLTLEEQDQGIEPKAEKLLRCITFAQKQVNELRDKELIDERVRELAAQRGIIVS